MTQGVVFTVGHSSRDFAEILQMLGANEVTCLVDVRSFPTSRKYPQWTQAAINAELPHDVGYRWIRELGGRRHTPAGTASENGAWRVKAFRDYADYMATDQFAHGLRELLDLVQQCRPAIMCSEAVPWRCHRRLITDALLIAGIPVTHIMSVTTTRSAGLNENARLRDGHLVYPPEQ